MDFSNKKESPLPYYVELDQILACVFIPQVFACKTGIEWKSGTAEICLYLAGLG